MISNPSLIDMLKDHYVFFLCEGTNEEQLIRWLFEEGKISLDLDSYTLDEVRKARGKAGRDNLKRILQLDYIKDPAIVYVLDSDKEKLNLGKEMAHIPVFYILTQPEIEILFIIHNDLLSEYEKDKGKKPSTFFKENCNFNCKDVNAMKTVFLSIDKLIETLFIYKNIAVKKSKLTDKQRSNKNQYFLADLINNE